MSCIEDTEERGRETGFQGEKSCVCVFVTKNLCSFWEVLWIHVMFRFLIFIHTRSCRIVPCLRFFSGGLFLLLPVKWAVTMEVEERARWGDGLLSSEKPGEMT